MQCSVPYTCHNIILNGKEYFLQNFQYRNSSFMSHNDMKYHVSHYNAIQPSVHYTAFYSLVFLKYKQLDVKKMLLILAICKTLFPAVCQSQSLLNDSTFKELIIGAEGFKNRYHSPSIVVVIVHDKKIIFSDARGYVDIENKVPATIDSKYPILSVTKTFTATMLMQLVERNITTLDDDTRKYVPEFKANFNLDKNRTTLFQLATHTSGLPRNSPADINFTKQVDRWLLAGTDYATIETRNKKRISSIVNWLLIVIFTFLSFATLTWRKIVMP
jgi:hypothetical protein